MAQCWCQTRELRSADVLGNRGCITVKKWRSFRGKEVQNCPLVRVCVSVLVRWCMVVSFVQVRFVPSILVHICSLLHFVFPCLTSVVRDFIHFLTPYLLNFVRKLELYIFVSKQIKFDDKYKPHLKLMPSTKYFVYNFW